MVKIMTSHADSDGSSQCSVGGEINEPGDAVTTERGPLLELQLGCQMERYECFYHGELTAGAWGCPAGKRG